MNKTLKYHGGQGGHSTANVSGGGARIEWLACLRTQGCLVLAAASSCPSHHGRDSPSYLEQLEISPSPSPEPHFCRKDSCTRSHSPFTRSLFTLHSLLCQQTSRSFLRIQSVLAFLPARLSRSLSVQPRGPKVYCSLLPDVNTRIHGDIFGALPEDFVVLIWKPHPSTTPHFNTRKGKQPPTIPLNTVIHTTTARRVSRCPSRLARLVRLPCPQFQTERIWQQRK